MGARVGLRDNCHYHSERETIAHFQTSEPYGAMKEGIFMYVFVNVFMVARIK